MKKLILLAVLFFVSACTKITKANYDALEMGMSSAQVNTLIGEPQKCSDSLGTKSCIWGDEDGAHIKVTFIADKAATFSHQDLK